MGEEWRLAKARSLVAMLALSPGHRRHREEIMDLLWPDLDPRAAANNLRYALHIARRTLGSQRAATSDLLVRQGDFIALTDTMPVRIDVDVFEKVAAEARESADPSLYRTAVGLYTGDLLPEDHYEDWAISRREGLHITYLNLLTEAAHLTEERGDLPEAIEWTERLVRADRVNEDAHFRLMRLYALAGRRHDALRQYRLLESALREDLDVSPDPATQALYVDILAWRFPEGTEPGFDAGDEGDGLGAGRYALPRYLTSFVGRQRDIAGVTALLNDYRLVTLTGIGGVGKTRLASVLVAELENRFRDGVFAIDLSSVGDPRLVWPLVASALNVGEDVDGDDALARVAGRDCLLVLDNCEHLADATARIIATVLKAGSGIRILATSREVLHVSGEAVWTVSPLDVPDAARVHTLDELRQSGAVILLLDRLRLRRPEVMLTEESAPYVAEMCRQLDGLPLALEMVAARAASLSLPDIVARLGSATALLVSGDRATAERHETLRAMLGWSYDLLTVPQRKVFARLSVFPGSWTVDTAEQVVVDDDIREIDLLNALWELVDKSLVTREGDALDTWYRYLAPVRQYAAEQLEQSGQADAVNRRHAWEFLTLAEEAEPHLRGPRQAEWMARLARNHDNLRAAFAWLLRDDPTLALRLAVRLGRFWYVGGHLREGRDALRAVLETSTGESLMHARALYLSGILADESGDTVLAFNTLHEGLALFRQYGEPADVATALNSLGAVAWSRGLLDDSSTLLEESLEIRRGLADPKMIASTLGNLALTEWSRGDLDRARSHLEESLSLAREADDDWSVALGLSHLGRIAWEAGDYSRARGHFSESLKIAKEVGDRGAMIECLEGLAGVMAALRDPAGAARLWGVAEVTRESLNLPIPAPDLLLYQRMVQAGRDRLSEPAFSEAWEAGRRSSLGMIVEETLATMNAHPPAGRNGDRSGLTARQREIAHLVARDLTNQQIADRLGIAHRTVDTHVSNILQTLGCSSRSEVAGLLQE